MITLVFQPFDERRAAFLRRTLNVWRRVRVSVTMMATSMTCRAALAADSNLWPRRPMSLLTVREHNAQKPEIAHFTTSAHKRATPLWEP